MTSLHARKIKDLCIALEALSRINKEGDAYDRVHDLLTDALRTAETYNPNKPTSQSLDEEIPF